MLYSQSCGVSMGWLMWQQFLLLYGRLSGEVDHLCDSSSWLVSGDTILFVSCLLLCGSSLSYCYGWVW